MRAMEIFYRIGGSLGGWLILTGHALILAVVPKATCAVDQLDPWRGTFVMGVLAALTLPLLDRGKPWGEWMRWAAAPALPLLLYDLTVVVPYLPVTWSGIHPCQVHSGQTLDAVADTWQRIWPFLQLVVVVGALLQAWRLWRRA